MIHDPGARGRALAEFFLEIEPRLFADLAESDTMARGSAAPLDRLEWACFALYACVRGLVAAGGFNRETAAAIEALHERVMSVWGDAGAPGEATARGAARTDVRARVAERYAEYGAIGQEGGASGAATVTARLGTAAARHVADESAPAGFAELIGELHESLAEGAAEAVRRGEAPRA
jgi:hypothetical protein